MRDIYKLIISIIACQAAGAIGSVFTVQAIPTWYATINKPAFTPPNWLFAPAWITLYLLMAIAAFLVWRRGLDDREARFALLLFLVQLVLNAAWTPVFFGLQSLLWGMVIILVLWVFIILTTVSFFRISVAPGVLMLPYLGWVTFASILNITLWMLN